MTRRRPGREALPGGEPACWTAGPTVPCTCPSPHWTGITRPHLRGVADLDSGCGQPVTRALSASARGPCSRACWRIFRRVSTRGATVSWGSRAPTAASSANRVTMRRSVARGPSARSISSVSADPVNDRLFELEDGRDGRVHVMGFQPVVEDLLQPGGFRAVRVPICAALNVKGGGSVPGV